MPLLDASDAECVVLTFAEGLLSPLGHDLALAVRRFTLEIDPDALSVEGRFDAGSLACLHALKGGAPTPGVLSDRDRRSIDDYTRRDVLHADRHPEVVFRSTAVTGPPGARRVEGRLSLHGTERAIALDVRRDGDRDVAVVRLHQPDFGIRPFKAMMGTLKVKPDVIVRVTVPAVG